MIQLGVMKDRTGLAILLALNGMNFIWQKKKKKKKKKTLWYVHTHIYISVVIKGNEWCPKVSSMLRERRRANGI